MSNRGDTWLLELVSGGLVVRTETGSALDPAAAQALLALGGPEPRWLRAVEALQAAAAAGAGARQLAGIAEALDRPWPEAAAVARATADPHLLLSLAVAGHDAVADNPQCTHAAWDALADHRDPIVARRSVARARLAPTLADHRDPEVRRRVAANPCCAEAALDALARDTTAEVRAAVATNAATGRRTLLRLSRDPAQAVARAAATNEALPAARLARLAWRGSTAAIRAAAVANESLPARGAALAVLDKSPAVRLALAKRRDASAATLRWLERYGRGDPPQGYLVMADHVAGHPNCPPSLVDLMCTAEPALGPRLGRTPPAPAPPRPPLPPIKRAALKLLAFPLAWIGFCLVVAAPVLVTGGLQALAHGAPFGRFVLLGLGLLDAAALIGLVRWASRRRGARIAWIRPPRPAELAALLAGATFAVLTKPASGSSVVEGIVGVFVLARTSGGRRRREPGLWRAQRGARPGRAQQGGRGSRGASLPTQ